MTFSSGFGTTMIDRKRPWLKYLSFGAMGLVIFIGSTFAANININTAGQVEFGQGLTQTSACDTNFVLTPIATFSNGNPGQFMLSGFRLSELDSSAKNLSTGLGCKDVQFTITAWADTGTALASYVVSDYGSSFYSPDGTVVTTNAGQTNSSTTLTLTSATISSQNVKKLTVETSKAGPRTYSLGDTGPGGGTVFYVNNSGFTCGATLSDTCKYMEYAPANWASGFSEWTTPSSGGGWSDSYALTRGAVDPPIPMVDNCTKVISGTVSIGAALYNTIALANCNAINAAEHVRAYRGGGLDDWGIPTRNDLSTLNSYRKTLYPSWASADDAVNGGISTIDAFWTSSGNGNGFYFEYLNRDTRGPLGPTNITYQLLIKPVRAFS